jgi:eukaryotic-like serine/threonine-protein kinase
MQDQSQADEMLMTLVEQALTLPEEQRQGYLRTACEGDSELFDQAWDYVDWEKRMDGFLLDPVFSPSAPETVFEPGQLLIGRFRIVREVAQGGMGIVWEAIDEKLDRRVAIKCAKAGFGKQLPPEVRNARQISHPNVCKIFEIHTDGEIDFIVMEFLEGETLAERLRRVALPKVKSRAIAQQLCAGLAEAHRNKVIHGDLKSNNVILTAEADGSMRAVITDFGLARQPGTPDELLAGTPDYMAPELWKGAKPSVASDIYALGVILCELVSGQKPGEIGGASSTLLLDQHPPHKPVTGNRKWNHVLARCLDPDPARRFPSAAEVGRALGPSRRLRWGLGIAAVVAILAAVAYQRHPIAPKETVRLAVLPFESGDTGLSARLAQDAKAAITHLENNDRTTLALAPAAPAATHSLHGTLKRNHGKIDLHAFLTDTRSGVNVKEWNAGYAPEEMRFGGVALAGLVAETLQLAPLVKKPAVNAKAKRDYENGLSLVRGDMTVDSALDAMAKAVAADPDSALTYAGQGEAQWVKYIATNDKTWLDRAAESVSRAESRNPDLAAVHRIAGRLDENAERYDQAMIEYQRAVQIEPENADGNRRLGNVYEFYSRLSEALTALQKAVEVEPKYFRTYQDLGAFYFRRGNYLDAIRQFRKEIEVAPREPGGHFQLANAYLNVGRYGEAEKELRDAIHLRETPGSLATIGLVLMYEGRERDAIGFFLRASRLRPGWYLPWLDLGICYRRTNQNGKARQANRRGLRAADKQMAKNPRNGHVRAFLAYLCASLGERGRAESEVEQALELSPKDADTRWMAVLTYEALRRREDALAVLAASSSEMLADLNRWPDVADLRKDSRFQKLLTLHGIG